MRLCVIIPALNAEPYIGAVVEEARAAIPHVYVVDDGSTDRTGEKALASGASVLTHDVNRGKGGALRTGYAQAQRDGFDAVVTMDADGQHLPSEMGKLVERFLHTGAPIVVGSRARRRSTMPLHRRANNALVSAVGTWLCGQPVQDFQCGYRLIRCDALRHILPLLTTTGYETESELLIIAGRLGFRIESVDVSTIYSGQTSHVRALREMHRFTQLLFRSLCRVPARLTASVTHDGRHE
ncbi:glycosyltransferase family 2 protein [Candidatus Poribacteria bacterium]|nr:glycosyltransferase family 2 protein [Candidatus Poribacteria bacterium]